MMEEVKITGTLRIYRALVINDEISIPIGYQKIGEIEADEEVCIIALPSELSRNRKLWVRLGNQAIRCLDNACLDASSITYGEYF
jgi:hypothetical protein